MLQARICLSLNQTSARGWILDVEKKIARQVVPNAKGGFRVGHRTDAVALW